MQLHHAKNYRPFELFANENSKLWNEANDKRQFFTEIRLQTRDEMQRTTP